MNMTIVTRIINTKIIFCLLLLFSNCNKSNPYPWFEGTLDSALEILDEKIIMLDFYTDW